MAMRKRVLLVLEGIVQRHRLHVAVLGLAAHRLRQVDALLDQPAVRGDVQIPLAELVHLALFFADHHRHAGLAHPVDLARQIQLLLFIGDRGQLLLQLVDSLVPVESDQVVHPHAGDLVDADQHRLAGFPRGRVVLHEIPRHLVEPLVGGDDVIVALEFPLQPLLDIDVLGLQLFQLFGDAFVEVADGHAQLVATGVVIERHRGLVLHRPLEVVGRDVFAEHPARDLVVLEQRRAGKADVAGIGQGVTHVERQRAVLGAVRLVGDDDDVVALAYRAVPAPPSG